MEATGRDVVPRAGTTGRRLLPIACGGALATAGLLVAANDPSAAGSRFPACSFRQLTGLWCPGCGLTRGTHQLLNGDLLGALGQNLFTPLVVIAVVAGWWIWLRRSWDRPVRLPAARLPRWVGAAALGTVVVYAVLRNVPAAPFTALAP